MKQVKKVICEKCGQTISKSNYTKHLRRHDLHPETFEISKYKLTHEGLNCQFCGKECKNRNSLCNHERMCKENPNKQLSCFNVKGFTTKGRPAWNRGLTKYDNDIILKSSIKISNKLKGRPKNYTEEQIRNYIYKGFQTKRKNKTLNSSKIEDSIYYNLCYKYGENNVIRHFRNELYPYECDFYITSIKLFIEINFHWTHGGRPFDPFDIKCQEQFNVWKNKAKTSKYYANAIDVWTRRDVIKLHTALKNNLNYIAIFNKAELDILFKN